ncbi:MAG TPA: Gfo/Idh/MocA family oxidoreductase [Candidatus Scybalocola faecigallinarum]|uniref:Gfo/Idh/MocA family oxidoreductase n=1 Tax=Candidatus Scybalocola faecigallinarum TaxID=2840941 RepID=A0A9D1F5P6_9FIRM|nr:Gfo/Idh/MocA family oxidoreductase [Candidatus Scybalocola faecigallinarum]
MKEIRVGIIGTGIIAHQHMKMYQEIPGVTVAAACDIRADVLEKFCDEYNIKDRYADYRELLKRDDLDSVDVCLHNNLHAPIAIEVMESGKHCYCEKPMAGAWIDAKAMADAAKYFGKKLHIQLSFLYGGQALAARDIIAGGHLGKIYHARSCGFRRRGRPYVDGYGEKEFDSKYWAGGGALFDMGVYRISQILYLMGLPKLERVSGQIYQELDMDPGRREISGFNVEEFGAGFAKFENNITMDIVESWAVNLGNLGDSVICGDKGGLTLSPVAFYSNIADMDMDAVFDIGGAEYRHHQLDPKYEHMDNSQKHWIYALRGEVEQIDTPQIALDTLLLSEGIYLSGRLGREVTADEIMAMSQSMAIKRQETPFGELKYKYPGGLFQ